MSSSLSLEHEISISISADYSGGSKEFFLTNIFNIKLLTNSD